MSEQTNDQAPDGFSADWLALRESADHSARSDALTEHLCRWASSIPDFTVTELGAGTGSNLRYLCPRLGHGQQWTLYDNDTALLQSMTTRLQLWSQRNNIGIHIDGDTLQLNAETFSAQVQWHHSDLASDLINLPMAGTHLVTGSALLDLTSAIWLQQLATRCIVHNCAALFVLNYNGAVRWQEPLSTDNDITALLNAHQLKDKGFGPALGPSAHAFFEDCLSIERLVLTEQSNWLLDNTQRALQQALIEGWGPAAIEQNPNEQPMIARWVADRSKLVSQQRSFLTVGHTDILSLPHPAR